MAQTGFRVKQFPNGEFTIGYVPPKKFDLEGLERPDRPRHGQQWWWQDPEKWKQFTCNEIIKEEQAPPLEYTHPPNSRKRGLTGITTHGSRLVRNAAYMLQKRYGHKCLSFLTLTMPSLTREEYICTATQWSSIVKRITEEITRELRRHGLSGNVVGVTEVQSKRLRKKWGLGLHLHLVFCGRKRPNMAWAISHLWFRECWLRVLSRAVGRRVESSNCENVVMVKRDASAYLGKYLTKGKQVISEVIEQYGEECIPSAWYTCSLKLRNAVKRNTAIAWDEDCDLVNHLPEYCALDAIRWVSVNQIEFHGRAFVVGFSGEWYMDTLPDKVPLYFTSMCKYDPTGV